MIMSNLREDELTNGAPVIEMTDIPLRDAIRNLARQAELNYILDPHLAGRWMGPDGKPNQEPSLTPRPSRRARLTKRLPHR